jgi:hypothetical protein
MDYPALAKPYWVQPQITGHMPILCKKGHRVRRPAATLRNLAVVEHLDPAFFIQIWKTLSQRGDNVWPRFRDTSPITCVADA